MPNTELKKQPFPVDIPFMDGLGIELMHMADGEAQLEITVEPWHCNSWQFNHGGLTMTLLDVVMSMAGKTLFPDGHSGITVEMKTTFIQSGGKPGERLVARGKAFHRATSMCFCEGEVWSGDRLVAKSSGTFKFPKQGSRE